ncbi:putative pentatricopeptide repeat-containing protein At2g01510 [Dioscorea cayenensis subsp. rotundata]|uniref:Pentatricopeptide repeat-containing protein At2g01510 n=1 Tax=Dioscorea cayennensis subsp. rotundata TaxID=55577 RepID=A0AB40B7I5_DIOCR|nr:putative pentatricopeptide repeat-containing protein At2g01510 [Dioscorea cayenensis subsp. rotundata]
MLAFSFNHSHHLRSHLLFTASITTNSTQFHRFLANGSPLNLYTIPTILASCGAQRNLSLGLQLHALAIHTGLDSNSFILSSLITMYSKCSHFSAAYHILNSTNPNDSISWNALIVSSSRSGLHSDALHLFVKMHHRALPLDEFTFPSALNSAAHLSLVLTGQTIHSLLLRSGFQRHAHIGNALVDMYAKSGELHSARNVFDEMPHRDVVAWTSLLTSSARHVSHSASLDLFLEMLSSSVNLDAFVIAAVLSSSAELTVLELGRQLHATSVKRGFHSFLSLGNALLTMYAKTGCIDDAELIFDLIPYPDAITWTALIIGLAQNGRGHDSVHVYDKMIRTGSKPDYITFIGLLFACSHAGLVEPGRSYFESMEPVHGIEPGPEHYACMIDLLARSGKIEEAVRLMNRMRFEPDATVWKALLSGCRVHLNSGFALQVAERAAEILFKIAPNDAVPYVLLSNIYSKIRRWGDVAKIRALMKARGVSKEPGCSWMEVGGVVHVFHVEDHVHPRTAEIYAKVDEMMGRIRETGYVAETGNVLQDVGEEGEMGLAYHSEKLAVAFGLVVLPRGALIRVFKNLRVCGDCHTALKLVTKVYGRKVVLRDANVFHHMENGVCSCGDYW